MEEHPEAILLENELYVGIERSRKELSDAQPKSLMLNTVCVKRYT